MATKSPAPSNSRALYDSLPEHLKAANRHLLDEVSGPSPEALAAKQEAMPVIPEAKPSGRQRKGPNKTEKKYRDYCLRGQDARYEAVSFLMSNGHRFTPDWAVFDRAGILRECHEVKGSYKLHSHGRARLAFDQARVEFWGITWVWAAQGVPVETYTSEQNLKKTTPGS
jgi:hypothetical protein